MSRVLSLIWLIILFGCSGAAAPVVTRATVGRRVSPGPPIVFEAEAFSASSSYQPNVPRPHDLTFASGRTALIRFPSIETLDWAVVIPEGSPSTLEFWMRYAAVGSPKVRWAFDDAPVRTTVVPPSGAYAGRDAWRWSRLGAVELGAGDHRLRLWSAPMRPDCFALRPEGAGPPDSPAAWPPVEIPPAVRARLAASAEPEAPPWIEDAARLVLPGWIEGARVGLHTRLSLPFLTDPLFEDAERRAASLGTPALVRHVKASNGLCYWPSAHGAVAPVVEVPAGPEGDPVEAMGRRAEAAGLRFVAYYRHQEDRPLARQHPDWRCRDWEGRLIRTGHEPRLCFHSPFAEVTLERLLELVDRGADAIYLDESHQPLEGCWCEWSRKAFEEATGLPLPGAPLLEDPLYRRFLEFSEASLAETLWRWRLEVRARDPEALLLVSSNRQPDLIDPRPTMRLGVAADLVKTELRKGFSPGLQHLFDRYPQLRRPSRDAMLTLGWVMSRDAAFGRPAHVWVHALGGAERWRAATAAIVASGCIANLDHPERSLPDPESYSGAIELGRVLGEPLAGARPLRSVCLHLPEWARDRILPDRPAAWTQVLDPFVTAWEALLRRRAPASVLSDDQLAAGILDGVRVLFLPEPESLTGAQQASVERFEQRGGRVVRGEVLQLVERVTSLGLPVQVETEAPVQVHWFRGPDGTLLLGVTNRPGWIVDPGAIPPPVVGDLRLRLSDRGRTVRVYPGGDVLTIDDGPSGPSVRVPTFRDAVVLRVEG